MAIFLQSVLFDAGHLPPSEHLFLQTLPKKHWAPWAPQGPLVPLGALMQP